MAFKVVICLDAKAMEAAQSNLPPQYDAYSAPPKYDEIDKKQQ